MPDRTTSHLTLLIAIVAFLVGTPVRAAETASRNIAEPSLPTFALTEEPSAPSPWSGLTVGTEVFGIVGGKNVRGGFGGAGYAGYNRELDNGIVLGFGGTAGYTPGFFKNSAITGYNFATTDVTVGYDMGRFMPFITGGIGLARANRRDTGYGGVTNTANDLFNATGDLRSFEQVGAGFAYKLTDKLTFEMAVQAFHGNASSAP